MQYMCKRWFPRISKKSLFFGKRSLTQWNVASGVPSDVFPFYLLSVSMFASAQRESRPDKPLRALYSEDKYCYGWVQSQTANKANSKRKPLWTNLFRVILLRFSVTSVLLNFFFKTCKAVVPRKLFYNKICRYFPWF